MMLVKLFKNVASPYNARIKPTIDELNNRMKRVKERVDVHNTHRLAVMQYDISALIGILDDQKRLQVSSHAIIAQLLQGIAADQSKEVDHSSLESMIKQTLALIQDKNSPPRLDEAPRLNVSVEALSDPRISLNHFQHCAIQSVHLDPKCSHRALNLADKPEVSSWLNAKDSALLWIDGFANARANNWTTEFAVDVLLCAQSQREVTLFFFGDVGMESATDGPASPKEIIHSFIVQLLRQLPTLANDTAALVTPEAMSEARRSSKVAWELLHHLLFAVPVECNMLYIVVDNIDTLFAQGHQPKSFSVLLQHISALVKTSHAQVPGTKPALPTMKVLFTAVTGTTHQCLFSPRSASLSSTHYIVQIPHTFGQRNVPTKPANLKQPKARRLARLPDSDDEFGFRPADSFEFSDDEIDELEFSSDDGEVDPNPSQSKTIKSGTQRSKEGISLSQHVLRERIHAKTAAQSDSSEEFDFSDDDASSSRCKKNLNNDDLLFSSDDEMSRS